MTKSISVEYRVNSDGFVFIYIEGYRGCEIGRILVQGAVYLIVGRSDIQFMSEDAAVKYLFQARMR